MNGAYADFAFAHAPPLTLAALLLGAAIAAAIKASATAMAKAAALAMMGAAITIPLRAWSARGQSAPQASAPRQPP